jgi:Spy/CpxP family protein refolding chaperone
MNKRTAVITILILAAVALIAAPMVFAGPGGHRGMRGHAGMHGARGMGGFGPLGHLNRVKEELDLSDAQVDQIKSIFKTLHEQNAASRESLRDGFKDAAEALIANPNDLAGAQALLDRQFAAEKALKSNMLVATSKALNVLTPDQRTKLSTLIAERAERRGRRNKAE